MSPNVILCVSDRSESLVTNSALVWSFTCVFPLVDFEIGLLNKLLSAKFAGVFLSHPLMVILKVELQSEGSRIAVTAALERADESLRVDTFGCLGHGRVKVLSEIIICSVIGVFLSFVA